MFNKFGDLGWVIVFIVFDCFTKPVQSVTFKLAAGF